MNATPLISIITPYRNAERFLPCLAATLQAQSYPHWECLLVDHASGDEGPALAARLAAADSRFRSLHEGDPRPLPALPRNRALGEARGDLICFLDVDDLWHPQKLERQLAFQQRQGLDISVTAYGRTPARGSGLLIRRCPPTSLSLRCLLAGNAVPMLTVMVRAALFHHSHESKPLRFLPVRHEDYVLWLHLWRKWPDLRYGCLPELLALHQRHSANLTAQRPKMLGWLFQAYRACGYGTWQAAWLAIRCAGRQACVAVCERMRQEQGSDMQRRGRGWPRSESDAGAWFCSDEATRLAAANAGDPSSEG